MDTIQLNAEHDTSVTCIPNQFIERYMPNANGEYVKVYLYLLRLLSHPTGNCNLTQLADIFEYTMRELDRALKYWERMGLLELRYNDANELCGITILDLPGPDSSPDDFTKESKKRPLVSESKPQEETLTPIPCEVPNAEVHVLTPTSRPEYTKDDVKNFSKQEGVSELLFIAEQYLKKPLTQTEVNSFLYWYDTLHFSTELIEYLVEYCVSREHRSVRYMDKVALSWAEAGIRDVAQAKQEANLYNQANYTVLKALGIKGRNLVDLETAMIHKWTNDFGFSLDLITEACTRTIQATHQPSFEYTDKILTNWHKAKVKELADVEKLDASFKNAKKAAERPVATTANRPVMNRFNNFNQRTYDYDQLEQQMLNRNRN
ncbi:DnaD and phage-associated domain-containing protein [Lachnospiraceae bacterium XBB1006]|nr:DnaD and phage-associated domain-containing protein [Lachnospiraceae bacterium XBB1006]